MNKVSSQLQNIGSKFSDVGKSLTKKITAPIMGIGIGAVKVGMDFEAGMSKVSAITGATGEDLKKLTAQAEDLGRKTQFSATQASEAMTYLGMAGWDTQEIMAGMPGMLDLAAASGEDLATTADIVSDALTAFGMKAEDAGHFADIMAKASSTANTNVSMLGESFKYAAPVAAAFGMSAEETTTALAMMANSGIKASQAGTALRGALSRLAKQPKEAADAMSELGIKISDAQGNMFSFNEIMGQMRVGFSKLNEEQRLAYASQIFGTEAMSGMLAVLNTSTEDFETYTQSLVESDGQSQKMASTMNDNLKGAFTRLKSAAEGAGIAISRILAPAVDSGVKKLNELVDKFNAMSPASQKMVLGVAGIVAVLPPIIWGLGTLMTSLSAITKGFVLAKTAMTGFKIASLANPIFLTVAAITALVASFVGLYRTNEEFRDKVNGIWSQIQSLAKNIFGDLQAFWNKWGDDIKAIFGGLWDAISIILNLLVDGFNIAFPLIANIVRTSIQNLTNILGSLLQILSGIIDFVLGVFTLDWERAWTGIKNIFGGIWNGIISIVQGAFNSIMAIIDGIIEGVKRAIDWVKQLIKADKDKPSTATTKTTPSYNTPSSVSRAVNWYAKGGVFEGASIIGVGEDRGVKEAVIPLSGQNMKPFADQIAKLMNGASTGINQTLNIFSPQELSPSEIKQRTLESSRQLAVEMGMI